MLSNYEAFLDATPEKGVVVVEYYWQRPPPLLAKEGKGGSQTSMIFFKRILAADKCWCGSKKQFARCHRREDDWTYVTLDPDQRAYSPVVLLDHLFGRFDYEKIRAALTESKDLLPLEDDADHAAWAFPMTPRITNEIGTLLLGSIELSRHEFRLETNSERRFGELTIRIGELLGRAVGAGKTRRTEPQQGFPVIGKKKHK